ncbi:hypothetical protein ACGF8B_23605 [Streptomyces sp. NPDC047917]|uniref:hypothetical protein n=1 Tax=Streptomyces sp. NPDC047917 TaxID=3365491 RepID=UPI00371A997B
MILIASLSNREGGIVRKYIAVMAAAVMTGFSLAGSAQAADVNLLSATNCTGNAGMTDGSGEVCIIVNGTGLKVNSVYVEKRSNNTSWTDYGRIEFSDGSGGYTSGSVNAARTETKRVGTQWGLTAKDGSKVCGWFSKFPGTKACATIHK